MIRAWGADLTLRLVAAILVVLAIAWIYSSLGPAQLRPAAWIADAPNYYAAGERLDAGHELYRYMSGDRQLPADPFALAGPFLYPPILGVIWRPLALLPSDVVLVAFWLLCMASLLSSVAWLLWRGGAVLGAASIALVVPIVWTAWAANVSAILIPLLVMTWVGLRRKQDVAAGVALGIAVSLKPTPALLIFWLFVRRRWTALLSALATVTVGLVIGALGAGLASYPDYFRALSEVSRTPGTIASVSQVLRSLGAPSSTLPFVSPTVVVGGAIATYMLRNHPKVSWPIAVSTILLASPAFNLTNVSVLITAILPIDRRLDDHLSDGSPSEQLRPRTKAQLAGSLGWRKH